MTGPALGLAGCCAPLVAAPSSSELPASLLLLPSPLPCPWLTTVPSLSTCMKGRQQSHARVLWMTSSSDNPVHAASAAVPEETLPCPSPAAIASMSTCAYLEMIWVLVVWNTCR